MNDQIHVLLVDDDERLLRSLQRSLGEAGFAVEAAISAAEASVMLQRYPIHAVVCDNQMVGTSGTRLLAEIRRDYPKIARFMLTGDISSAHSYLVEREIGVVALFSKPCAPAAIIRAIREHVVPTGCGSFLRS